jgi:hypothetical protein
MVYPTQLPTMPFGIPPGAVIAFAGKIADPDADAPEEFSTLIETYGWLPCDGRPLHAEDYPLLYGVIGNQYNKGTEPEGVFRIPDYRGYVLCMADMNSGNDPDAQTRQQANGRPGSGVGTVQQPTGLAALRNGITTHPGNVYVYYIIKFI